MNRPANLLTKEQVIDAYLEKGMTIHEAAAFLGVGPATFERYLRRFGIERRRQGTLGKKTGAPYQKRDAMLMRDFEAGKPVAEIADKFRLSRQRVHVILKRLKGT